MTDCNRYVVRYFDRLLAYTQKDAAKKTVAKLVQLITFVNVGKSRKNEFPPLRNTKSTNGVTAAFESGSLPHGRYCESLVIAK
jgi:hypothetical protein